MSINIFISHSHKDREYTEAIYNSLKLLENQKKITLWYDKNLNAGDEFWDIIENKITNTDIFLALISTDYLNSPSCNREKDLFLQEKKNNSHKVFIPIIVRECAWLDTDLKNFNGIPSDGQTVANYQDKDSVYKYIYDNVNKVIENLEIKNKSDFINYIETTTFNINEHHIKLSEIFQKPKMDKINEHSKFQTIKIDNDFFKSKDRFFFFIGAELSGKTSLLYHFILNNSQYNILPLYIDCKKYHKTVKHEEEISKIFHEQYIGSFNMFKIRNNKVAMIDNFDEHVNPNFIEWINGFFDYIIIAIDYEKYMSYCQYDELYKNYSSFFIQPFNRKSTFLLIDKWTNIQYGKNTIASQQNTNILESKVNDIILSKHLFPTYPFYILSIIQALEHSNNLEVTSYGDCYQVLLLYNLSKKGINKEDINDSAMNYLIYIAYRIYKDNSKTPDNAISIEIYNKFKAEYQDEYHIKDNIINRIENDSYKILNINYESNQVQFQFKYIYYFLSSKGIALKFNIKELNNLLDSLPNTNSSYILTFLTHHLKNNDIINNVLNNIKNLYANEKPFLLETQETSFLRGIISLIPDKIKDNPNKKLNRIQQREEVDKFEENYSDNSHERVNEFEQQKQIEKSLQLIRITGQIIKNWGGSYPKSTINKLLYEVELLNFRVLSFSIKILNDREILKSFLSSKKITENNIEKIIHIMCLDLILRMLSYGFNSISTEKIIESQEIVSSKIDTPAFDFILLLAKLTYDKLDIEHIRNLKKKFDKSNNLFAQKTLILIIQSYLDMFTVDFRDKQSLINIFNLERKNFEFIAAKNNKFLK